MAKQTIDELAVIISADSQSLTGGLKHAERALREFRKNVEVAQGAVLKTPPRPAQIGWARAMGEDIRAMGRSASSASKDLAAMALQATLTGGTMVAFQAGLGGVVGLFEQLKDSVNMAAELEMTTLAFEVMLKSGDKARAMLADIRRFAATTPFNTQELTDASRKLIAYGIAGDQVMPTLRMLGDVASATQTPISDLAYLYGTLNAQQRAYSRDIYQFSNRGIPIYEELAKVLGKSVGETRDLIEEGKVGFPEVVRAFKAMTEGEGRYAGLTRRQSGTMAGQLEAAMDAFRLAKLKFGQILIEEFGLKDSLRDFDAFMKRVSDGMDSIRPAVRFVGDMFKGIIQHVNEFGRVLNAVATSGAFARAFPQLAEAARDFRAMVADAQNFKLDEEQVLQFAENLTIGLTVGFIELTQDVMRFGLALKHAIVDPIRGGMKEADETLRVMMMRLDQLNKLLKSPFLLAPIPRLLLGENGPDLRKLLDEEQKGPALPQGPLAMPVPPEFLPPSPLENNEAVIARAKALYAQQGKVAGQFQRGAATAGDVQFWKEVEDRFLSQFVEDANAARHMLVVQGQMPTYKADAIKRLTGGELARPVDVARPGEPAQPGYWDRFWQNVEKSGQELANRKPEDAIRAIQDTFAPMRAAARRKAETDAATARHAREEELAGMAALGGGFLALRDAVGKAEEALVQIPQSIPADWQEAAKKAKEEFGDPLEKLQKETESLFNAHISGLIDRDTYDAATAAAVRRAGERYGAGGPYQLPDTAMKDTAEAARIITNWQAQGVGGQNAVDVLKQIRDILAERKQADRKFLEGFPWVGNFDFGP